MQSLLKTSDPLGPTAVTVRVAVPDDKAFVVGLAGRFGETRAGWREYEEVVNGTRRALAQAFDRPNDADIVLIALDARAERIGFSYVVTQRDFFTLEAHGHISEIATIADGSGAGDALMAASEAWGRARGFRYLSLNVNDTNENAHRFYRKRAYLPEYRHLAKLL